MEMGGNGIDSIGIPMGMRFLWEYDENVSCFGLVMVMAMGITTWQQERHIIVFVCVCEKVPFCIATCSDR